MPFTFRPFYMSVEETESALLWLAAPPAHYPFVERFGLPNATWDGRGCTAIRVGNRMPVLGPQPQTAVYFIGGVHAREWGSADILVNFLEILVDAYVNVRDVTIGGKGFTFWDIRRIVHELDVFVFPQVNPDGRAFSMHPAGDEMWRKNRRWPPGSLGWDAAGVDINRNYPFMWEYHRHFAPDAPVRNSLDPRDETYIGPYPASEPETRNVIWVLDSNPHIRYFVDLHSYSELVLFPWGDDDNQPSEPQKSFTNPDFDGLRGHVAAAGHPLAGAYAEFIPAADQGSAAGFAQRIRDAIAAVRGTSYGVDQAVQLFPTAGASDDYSFSRHLADPSKTKVYPVTLEWGKYNPSDLPASFHPPYDQMRGIIDDVTAGLFEACMVALESQPVS